MLFNSSAFVVLLAVTFGLYYLPWLRTKQLLVLILSSLVFYAYEDPALVALLLFSATLNIVTSYFITYGDPVRRMPIAVLGVALNLAALALFKYGALLANAFSATDDPVGHFLLTIPLPIGISFFTFEGISLLVDVYKQNYAKGEDIVPSSFARHTQRTLFFISFFPHLIAGPILKAHDLYPQIGPKRAKDIEWVRCFKSLVTGYFLKMVVADNLKDFTFWMDYPFFLKQSSLNLTAMLLGYSVQIFADFAGYSLIAIGLAKLFGYDFNQNFNFPYISSSFKEFWKRWHISLSSFLMEYLYFPLGGNRKGRWRTYANLMITMVLGGLWHGAAWSYAVWGAFHGGALALERFATPYLRLGDGRVVRTMRTLGVFLCVTLAWLLFKISDASHVLLYLRSIGTNLWIPDKVGPITSILIYSSPVLLYHMAYLLREKGRLHLTPWRESICYGAMLFLLITNSGSAGAFIYFQF